MSCWYSRRKILQGAGAALALPAWAPAQSASGMPGPWPGRVVAVQSPRALVRGRFDGEAIREMMRRGMTLLAGAPAWPEAWKQLFSRGDVVGIKVNPVGQPHAISSPEVLREIIAGLNAAGVPNRDIVVYDRYRKQFFDAGFHTWLPEGVRTMSAAEDFELVQQRIEGYDPDQFVDFPVTLHGQDTTSLTARRSHLALFISRQVNKLINLPVLKDHRAAGVTLALKNLSHGLVNNVNRSHSTPTLNATGTFIPAVVSHPIIRSKAVLHILDGIKGVYNDGPGAKPEFVWQHDTLYFATDPVALDRTGWEALDAKRVASGLKRLIADAPDGTNRTKNRQPEHVEIAGAMGLGIWDAKAIDLRRVPL